MRLEYSLIWLCFHVQEPRRGLRFTTLHRLFVVDGEADLSDRISENNFLPLPNCVSMAKVNVVIKKSKHSKNEWTMCSHFAIAVLLPFKIRS